MLPSFGFFMMPMEVFVALAVFAAVGGGIAWYLLDRARKARDGSDQTNAPTE
jgi:hypothetical protein